MGAPSRREIGRGTCPRCGTPVPQRATGRPATWCSHSCRRAAYEERRAARTGAIAVELVDRVVVREVRLTHSPDDCVQAVLASPTATARLLRELTGLLFVQEQIWNPRWSRVIDTVNVLLHLTMRWSQGRPR